MKIALLVLLLVVLAVVLWRRLASGSDNEPAARRPALPKSPWRCVSIDTGLNACRAAERLRGERFLPQKAPALPLKGCDEGRCACRYLHHPDRRADDRRDAFSRFDGLKPTPEKENKRRGRNRRRGDSQGQPRR